MSAASRFRAHAGSRRIVSPLLPALLLGTLVLTGHTAGAASGLFPKMPPANTVYVADATSDGSDARRTAWALEGLINRTRAESYVMTRPEDLEQLNAGGKPSVRLPSRSGGNLGLRTLFSRYSGQVERMFVYDPDKDWTVYLALMASAPYIALQLRAITQTMMMVLGSLEQGRPKTMRMGFGSDGVWHYFWSEE